MCCTGLWVKVARATSNYILDKQPRVAHEGDKVGVKFRPGRPVQQGFELDVQPTVQVNVGVRCEHKPVGVIAFLVLCFRARKLLPVFEVPVVDFVYDGRAGIVLNNSRSVKYN